MLLVDGDRFVWGIFFPSQRPKRVHMIFSGISYLAKYYGTEIIAAPLSAFYGEIESQSKLGYQKWLTIDNHSDISASGLSGRLVLGLPKGRKAYMN